ncbi:hypothetical protein [Pseudonocardia sp.]|uniref:hypothetical protein n=1 Tax=Pseudonocardia sp. TaxID=60912 RepID=UPI003D0D1AAB
MFSADSPGTARFERVACDLSDVLGTPGTGDACEVADRLGHALDQAVETLPGDDGWYLRSAGGVGAFAAAPDAPAALAATAAAVDTVLAQPPDASRVVTEVTSPSGVHQVRVQLLAGRRVIGGSYRLHTTRAGQVAVSGYPVGDLAARDPGPPPRRRRATVVDAMRAQLALPATVELEPETVLFPVDGGAVWAYAGRGVLWDEETLADLRVIVRADDLSLLVSRDAAPSAVWGEGRAYPANPARDTHPVTVRLADLDAAADLLRGPLLDVAPRTGARPERPRRDWRLDADGPDFDDVCAYHHLSRAAGWLAPLVGPDVFGRPPFTPLQVVTGDRATRAQVGRFLPSRQAVVFGDGPRPGARSADICAHELTHAVVWGTRRIDDVGPVEARGLNEGFADYAQASLLADPRIGDWVAPGQMRDCSSAAVRFPAQPVDVYAVGAAWAAVLWDLRDRLGAGVADAVAFASVFFLEETSTVAAARAALLGSDATLFPAEDGQGRHADEIAAAFDARLP